ncbi:MAG: hypothetical protein KatS3mg103_0377 [Phycisphaerales bacterium]|nr:MAG: hypothetical protein KatS3mg103_0377 [Phycisphaerales bacterium]
MRPSQRGSSRSRDFPTARRRSWSSSCPRATASRALCLSLLGAELNIHFAYPLMLRPNGTATIALSVDDMTLAGQILRRKCFRLFGEADLPAA